MKKYKIGYAVGVFDMFHIGHLNLLKRAKALCEILVVGMNTDELCFIRKNKYPIINQEDRKQILEAIRYVDKVVYKTTMNNLTMCKDINADVVFVGSDWQNTKLWNEYEKELNNEDIDVVYLPYTEGISSTILREKI